HTAKYAMPLTALCAKSQGSPAEKSRSEKDSRKMLKAKSASASPGEEPQVCGDWAFQIPEQRDGTKPDIDERASVLVLINAPSPLHGVNGQASQVQSSEKVEAKVRLRAEISEHLPAKVIAERDCYGYRGEAYQHLRREHGKFCLTLTRRCWRALHDGR